MACKPPAGILLYASNNPSPPPSQYTPPSMNPFGHELACAVVLTGATHTYLWQDIHDEYLHT